MASEDFNGLSEQEANDWLIQYWCNRQEGQKHRDVLIRHNWIKFRIIEYAAPVPEITHVTGWFTRDLNAVALMESSLDRRQGKEYARRVLMDTCGSPMEPLDQQFKILTADAPTRVRALLTVLRPETPHPG